MILRLATIATALLLLAGCGGGGDEPEASSQDAAVAATTVPGPDILEPANGDTITASAQLGDNISAKVPVRGTAEPGRKLRVSAQCQVVGCVRTVTTDDDGKFSVDVNVTVDVADPSIGIAAEYDDSFESDRVVITVGEPSEEAEPKPKSRSRSQRKAKSKPKSRTAPPTATAPPASTAAPTATAPPSGSGGGGRTGSVVIIGDSLAQGIQPHMATALPGWSVSVDARIGRPLAEGMRIFANTQIKANTVYAFSLFTNDDPRSVSALEQAVRTSVDRAGCAVWATIVRPPEGGTSYDGANRALQRLASGPLAGRLQIVDWAGAVSANPSWISSNDRVHATPEGYRNRAALYARAIRNCA
jgi:hypothetical protein